jgi:hypothetical protein
MVCTRNDLPETGSGYSQPLASAKQLGFRDFSYQGTFPSVSDQYTLTRFIIIRFIEAISQMYDRDQLVSTS